MKSPPRSGVLAAVLLLAIGVAAAGIAWWNTRSHTRRTLDFWGSEAALLIRDAPRVTAGRVEVKQHAKDIAVLQQRDISRAKGLVHLRHALLDDRSFAWAANPNKDESIGYSLKFAGETSELTVYFSGDFSRLEVLLGKDDARSLDRDRVSLSTEPISQGLRHYFSDVLNRAGEPTR